MAAEVELVQVKMATSVDFANKGELVWMEPALAQGIIGAGLAVKVREKEVEVPDAPSSEGDREPHAGNGAGSGRKR
jgi:hypothetical protein